MELQVTHPGRLARGERKERVSRADRMPSPAPEREKPSICGKAEHGNGRILDNLSPANLTLSSLLLGN